jgi:hypothetical protein
MVAYSVKGYKRVEAVVPEKLYGEFRRKVVEKYDGEKGAVSKAVVEALKLWLKPS